MVRAAEPQLVKRRVVDDLPAAACAEIAAALAHGGTLALSGGSTPQPVHARLATLPLPWERITVFFVDERAVPPDDPQSNYGAARAALLDHVPASVLRMRGELPAEEAAAEYERLLPARFDVVLLGLGADGHTASLFPGDPSLDERERLVVAARAPVPPVERITLTLPALARAERMLFLVSGAGKAAAVAAVAASRPLPGASAPPPASRVAPRTGEPLWLLDAAAADLA